MRFNPQGHLLLVDLSWAGQKGLIETINTTMLWQGLFFGGLLVMWCYNFLLYVKLSSRDYLYYLYYLACVIGLFVYLNGFAPFFIESPQIYEPIFAMFAFGAAHGGMLFARQFLSLKKYTPRLDQILVVAQWTIFSWLVLSPWLLVGVCWPILNYLVLFIGPLIITGAAMRLYQGFKPARYYVAGWAVFILALIIYALSSLGILPINTVTTYSVQVASIWEVILFALAIAYRLKLSEQSDAKAKTAFLGMISHELKTPLQAIGSTIDLLSLKMPQNNHLFERLRVATGHLELQVKDLTDYSRLESGVLKFRKGTVNVSKLVHEVVDEFRPKGESKGLEVRTHIEDNVIVSSDAYRLQQILNNLIGNAIKYTDTGYIDVRMESQNTWSMRLIFSVKDSGIGISEEHIPILFEPFTQIDRSNTRDRNGIGMGLAIVQRLVSIFRGSIKVQSNVGEGSTFTVKIPVENAGDTVLVSEVAAIENKSDKHIMLVDDNEGVRSNLKDVIENLGYTCELAESGKVALKLIKGRKYAAILLDINMPDMDGFTVAAHIRRRSGVNQQVPIIWISATGPENFTKEEKKSFTFFLEKPVRSNQLDATLRKIINS
jgi:signal transduction histidine kinase/CheY-like chemotaxis protein